MIQLICILLLNVNLQFAEKLPCMVTLFITLHGNKQLAHLNRRPNENKYKTQRFISANTTIMGRFSHAVHSAQTVEFHYLVFVVCMWYSIWQKDWLSFDHAWAIRAGFFRVQVFSKNWTNCAWLLGTLEITFPFSVVFFQGLT